MAVRRIYGNMQRMTTRQQQDVRRHSFASVNALAVGGHRRLKSYGGTKFAVALVRGMDEVTQKT